MRNWLWSRQSSAVASAEALTAVPVERSRWQDILHVCVLFNFGVAQPVYDRLSERAALFVDQVIGLPVVYLLVFVLSFVLPALIVGVECLFVLGGRRCYEFGHRAVLWILWSTLTLPLLKQIEALPGLVTFTVAVLGAWGAMRLYLRSHTLRTMVSVAAVGIAVFPTYFLINFSSHFGKLVATAHRTERWNPVPVVVVVFDEFCGASLMTTNRDIDRVRFPHFAELAESSTWFRNATSVNPNTIQALPAILSGRYPTSYAAPVPKTLPQNLFSVLQTTGGYDLVAFEPVSLLAPSGTDKEHIASRGLLPQTAFIGDFLWRVYLFHLLPISFQEYLPEVDPLWFGLHNIREVNPTATRGVFRYHWGAARKAQYQHFLNSLDGAERPTLYFMHVLLPHIPWCYLPSGNRYAEDGEDWELLTLDEADEQSGNWGPDELDATHNQRRHLLQLIYVDQLIGQLISRLKSTGLYDRCLLVVTADHGIAFRPDHPRRIIDAENRAELLSIPLFVKRPGQHAGVVNDQDVESVDIFPTIAGEVGIELEARTDGWSMFDPQHAPRQHKTYGGFQEMRTVDPAVIRNSEIPQHILRRFGPSSNPDGLFHIGPHPDLIGRPVSSLNVELSTPVTVELLRYDDQVHPGPTKVVPCLFEGRLELTAATATPTVLAVAVNGTIQAVTRTYLQPGQPSRQFAAMVPEHVYQTPQNDVQFYVVTGSGPGRQLRLCRKARWVKPKSLN